MRSKNHPKHFRVERAEIKTLYIPAEKVSDRSGCSGGTVPDKTLFNSKMFLGRNEIQGLADHVCGKFFSDGEGRLSSLLVNCHVGLK